MRLRLVEATIAVLQRVGYAAVTTQLVMDEAGVSRGAMLHHFPTKIDLIIAVAQHAATAQNHLVVRELQGVENDTELYLAITRATWRAVCEPSGLALVEIMMASRSDLGLSERLPAVVNDFQTRQTAEMWRVASRIGIRDRATIERMVRLHRAALRGLAIEMMFSGEAEPAAAAVDLLDWYKRRLTGHLLTEERL